MTLRLARPIAPFEHFVPAATACMIAELPVQMPNCVPSAEHTSAPGLEQAVPDAAPADPVEPVEPAEAPAAGVAAGVAAAAAEGEARIVAVPGTAAEGDAA